MAISAATSHVARTTRTIVVSSAKKHRAWIARSRDAVAMKPRILASSSSSSSCISSTASLVSLSRGSSSSLVFFRNLSRSRCLPRRVVTTTVRRARSTSCRSVEVAGINNHVRIHKRSFSSSSSSSSSWRDRIRLWNHNGSVEIFIGSGLLLLCAVDQIAQYGQEMKREWLMALLDPESEQEKQEGPSDEMESPSSSSSDEGDADGDDSAAIALFQCTVRRLPNLDGTKTLNSKHMNIGDVVDVVEERVGPGGMYHMCRHSRTDTVGWFPLSCLTPIGQEEEEDGDEAFAEAATKPDNHSQ